MSVLSKAAISLTPCIRILKILSNQVIEACIVIGLQRCTVADYGSKLLYLVTILQFYALPPWLSVAVIADSSLRLLSEHH